MPATQGAMGLPVFARPQAAAPTSNFIEKRVAQLHEMTAHRPPKDAKPRPWPDPTPDTLHKFLNRHAVGQLYSGGFIATQRRMLFLADVEPDKRLAAFDEECYYHRLAPTTAESYWTAWMTAQSTAGFQPCDVDKQAFCFDAPTGLQDENTRA